MSDEVVDAKLVQRTVAMLRMARQVIQKVNAGEDGERFQEEPSLSDLVLVAQIIGQTSTIDRLGEMSGPPDPRANVVGREPVVQSLGPAVGEGIQVMLPDLAVIWGPEGWYVTVHPDFQQEPQCCRNSEELSLILQQMAVVCAQNRMR